MPGMNCPTLTNEASYVIWNIQCNQVLHPILSSQCKTLYLVLFQLIMADSIRNNLSTKLTGVIGSATEFIPSEVPTLRSLISQGLLLQEEKIRQEKGRNSCMLSQISEDLADLLQTQWTKSKARFVYPATIERRSIIRLRR